MYQFHCTVMLLFATAIAAGMPFAAELRFASENIDVGILPPDTVEVIGEYFFTTSDGRPYKGRVIYPFPSDSGAGIPFDIAVQLRDLKRTLPFDQVVQGITFAVAVPRNDTVCITVIYRQCFGNKSGRYILTTTAGWGQPLVNSRYTLHVPDNVALKYFSYACDSVYTSGTGLTYSFFKKQFMPDRDLMFTWQVGNVSASVR